MRDRKISMSLPSSTGSLVVSARIRPSIRPGGFSTMRYLRGATLLLMFLFLTVGLIIGVMRVADEYRDAIDTAHRTARATATTLNTHAGRALGETVMVAAGLADVYRDQLNG